ncbi:MAG TPA: Maf family protein [Candidatus Baltobacteraceae bacterium]|jgi:septum formation protein|nr:Maf family protein [Candidatus Baltobacteraceae bacterium]
MLILASASPRRAELLRQLGLDFEVIPSGVPEVQGGALSPGEVAQINAYRKARAVAERFADAITLGTDTVVVMDKQIFGKPASMTEAEKMLSALQGRRHQVVTGVCLIHLRAHRRRVFLEQTEVTFRHLDLKQIRHYLKQTNPLDKAGGYGIQDQGDVLVEAISGSFTNVIGLPLERFQTEWAAFTQPAVMA